ncbi:MAG: DNA mismatch repair protein MutS, partial [Syntrophomonadaceae bacterium]|nr:DNA mismatch repair protein MutS [Syntrophomonadaceae bacterium]
NLTVSVIQSGDSVTFMKKVLPGKADKSYGIHVARLAGLPAAVIQRADEILLELEAGEKVPVANLAMSQASLFAEAEPPLIEQLRRLNLDGLSPREALLLLYKWKEQL